MRTLAFASLILVSVAFVAWGANTAPPNLGKAIEAQRMLAKERPQDPQVLNDLGNLLVLSGDRAGALSSYEQAIEIDPSLTSAHYNLGLLLQQQGERRKALGEYRKVLKAQPDNAWAHFQAAVLLEEGKDVSEAVKHYAEAFRLNPQLSFSEVNPQVIDSKLVTKALLLAHRDGALDTTAPRDYSQPSRIVALMVAPSPAAQEAAAEAPMAPPAPAKNSPSPRASVAPDAGAPAAGRTLRAEDLEPERGGAAGSTAPRRGGSRVTTAPPSGPTGNFTRPRIAPGVQPGPPPEPPRYTPPPPSETYYEGDESSGAAVAPSTTDRLRFVPGVQSSGRLEMKLVPDARPGDGDSGRGLS